MTDLMTAVRGAVYRALESGSAAQAAPVFTEVPQGTKPPYFEIGTIHFDDVSAKGSTDDRRREFVVELWSVWRGEARGPLLAMMAASEQDLDRQPIAADGAALRPPRLVKATASDADADGVTYAGVQYFTIQAQPA